eukprot:CAMPEP_0194415772 /NCGR_PEP_ID=MMETSP0176-20130528/14589_1 /TAXON_ID=216777 /ORGANISM="Proboscia alata, Strain PI-D3" /LENGTH=99 /DNA_ID=CAMNT_0039220621 /DNA_START=65 /DNA_END=361 /DNA_ORIENTATION=+
MILSSNRKWVKEVALSPRYPYHEVFGGGKADSRSASCTIVSGRLLNDCVRQGYNQDIENILWAWTNRHQPPATRINPKGEFAPLPSVPSDTAHFSIHIE